MRVEIFSDVVCPWCYIGKRRFEAALSLLRDSGVDEPIEVTFRSYLLDPRAPTGEPVPVTEAYARKFGGPEMAGRIIADVTAAAAAEGIEFRMDRALRANTILAHRALHRALAVGGPRTQSLLKERLMRAYFTDGLDVGDPATVIACAGECGLDVEDLRSWLDGGGGIEEVTADLAAAAGREITAVPTFVIDERVAVPGAQDPALFVSVIKRLLSRPAGSP